jgi:hypothetical protein
LARSHFVRCGIVLGLLGGCSPTYQSLYEGDVRFEHCYRVDEERQVPVTDKLHCWSDWTRRYTYGQSRDRIDYAIGRERTLARALATGEQTAPRGAEGKHQQTLPQPTNAFATPPQTMTPANAGAEGSGIGGATLAARTSDEGDAGTNAEGSAVSASETSPTLVDAPGASCAGACGKTWSGCKQQCKWAPCRSGCDEHYRKCMRGCF